jgi:hypothetical protein
MAQSWGSLPRLVQYRPARGVLKQALSGEPSMDEVTPPEEAARQYEELPAQTRRHPVRR